MYFVWLTFVASAILVKAIPLTLDDLNIESVNNLDSSANMNNDALDVDTVPEDSTPSQNTVTAETISLENTSLDEKDSSQNAFTAETNPLQNTFLDETDISDDSRPSCTSNSPTDGISVGETRILRRGNICPVTSPLQPKPAKPVLRPKPGSGSETAPATEDLELGPENPADDYNPCLGLTVNQNRKIPVTCGGPEAAPPGIGIASSAFVINCVPGKSFNSKFQSPKSSILFLSHSSSNKY